MINPNLNPTIVALATAPMNCAIHIIRISGYDTYPILNSILKKPITKDSFKIKYNYILDDQHQPLDEVLLMCYQAPKSYTGEDMVEINCHGGIVVAQAIIDLLLKHGATLASRGEFTQRAMLNKKIDVSQVEAISNIVYAKNIYGVKGAMSALDGSLTKTLKEYQHTLMLLIGNIEVHIDYPEFDENPEISPDEMISILQDLTNKLSLLVKHSKRFMPLKQGIKIALIGAPNAGKSSLLNALSHEDKAIVSNIAGTTRDVIENTINIDNLTLRLFDTAGLRETEDSIEKIGVQKAIETITKADLVVYLIDQSHPESVDDTYLNLIQDKLHIIAYNKCDLVKQEPHIIDDHTVCLSALENEIEPLITLIKTMFKVHDFNTQDYQVAQSTRQLGILENAVLCLQTAISHLQANVPVDLVVDELQRVNYHLNQILGNDNQYDFLDELFANFCVGK